MMFTGSQKCIEYQLRSDIRNIHLTTENRAETAHKV